MQEVSCDARRGSLRDERDGRTHATEPHDRSHDAAAAIWAWDRIIASKRRSARAGRRRPRPSRIGRSREADPTQRAVVGVTSKVVRVCSGDPSGSSHRQLAAVITEVQACGTCRGAKSTRRTATARRCASRFASATAAASRIASRASAPRHAGDQGRSDLGQGRAGRGRRGDSRAALHARSARAHLHGGAWVLVSSGASRGVTR